MYTKIPVKAGPDLTLKNPVLFLIWTRLDLNKKNQLGLFKNMADGLKTIILPNKILLSKTVAYLKQ